jgi:hypothetical protein
MKAKTPAEVHQSKSFNIKREHEERKASKRISEENVASVSWNLVHNIVFKVNV